MTLEAKPPAFLDWDDADFIDGEGFGREDFEQMATNQRWLRDQVGTILSPWRLGSDVYDHFRWWTSSGPLRPWDLADSVSIDGGNQLNLVTADGHYLSARSSQGIRTEAALRLSTLPTIMESRVTVASDAAGEEPWVGFWRDINFTGDPDLVGSNGDAIFFTRGLSSNTWLVQVWQAGVKVFEDGPFAGQYTAGWDILRVDADANRVIFLIDNSGSGFGDSLVEVSRLEVPADIPSGVLLAPGFSKKGTGLLKSDYLIVRSTDPTLVSP